MTGKKLLVGSGGSHGEKCAEAACGGDVEVADITATEAGAAPERGMTRGTRVRLVLSAVMLLASAVLRLLFARLGAALFPAWRHLTRAAASVQATLASVVPFALWDVLACALLVLAVAGLVLRLRRRRPLLPWVSWVALVGSWMLLSFVGWACNHYAPPLASYVGLTVGQYSTDELADATGHYLAEAAILAPQVQRNDDGTLADQDFYELARAAGSSYAGLGEESDVFRGSAAPVKALLLWGEPQLYSGHTGIYWAPTGEAGVPLRCATADLGFTMCHEAAHRLGIASEQEANFAAFLACRASDDVRLAYSGSYNAFIYCLNALLRQDPERAQQVVQKVADAGLFDGVGLVLTDRAATREHYAAYDGAFKQVGTTVNDTYLRGFGEDSGVRSYGLVVDYLIAWDQQFGEQG